MREMTRVESGSGMPRAAPGLSHGRPAGRRCPQTPARRSQTCASIALSHSEGWRTSRQRALVEQEVDVSTNGTFQVKRRLAPPLPAAAPVPAAAQERSVRRCGEQSKQRFPKSVPCLDSRSRRWSRCGSRSPPQSLSRALCREPCRLSSSRYLSLSLQAQACSGEAHSWTAGERALHVSACRRYLERDRLRRRRQRPSASQQQPRSVWWHQGTLQRFAQGPAARLQPWCCKLPQCRRLDVSCGSRWMSMGRRRRGARCAAACLTNQQANASVGSVPPGSWLFTSASSVTFCAGSQSIIEIF